MIFVDSNVIIDAQDKESQFRAWAEQIMADALSTDGIALNPIVLAELCVGQDDPKSVEVELREKGLTIVDLPAAAASICARAYTRYRVARKRSGGREAPLIPPPDFFIGAHAELTDWALATRDPDRYQLYFPEVKLIQP